MTETIQTDRRTARIEAIATELIPTASLLTRLALGQARGEISRSEGGVLRTLTDGPRRVTELAEREGLSQPTTTVLVKQLEKHGWVKRGHDPDDGRVVLVSLTAEGARALEHYRARYRAVLKDCITGMADEDIAALEDAVHALAGLVDEIQKRAGR